MDLKLIDAYETGGMALKQAVDGLSPTDLKAFPVLGTWSIQQIVIHLMDSDLIASDRMKRIIAEENPTLLGYDETKFAAGLHYHDQSVEDALTLFALNRRQTVRILRLLPESAFSRIGTHNERGAMTLEHLIEGYIHHLAHHLKFIRDKRKMLGK